MERAFPIGIRSERGNGRGHDPRYEKLSANRTTPRSVSFICEAFKTALIHKKSELNKLRSE